MFSFTLDRLFLNLSEPLFPVADLKSVKPLPSSLPPMPGGTRQSMTSVSSYWAMHVDLYREYVHFARLFFVALESVWDVHGDTDRCPLTFEEQDAQYSKHLCWCFIMERIVNIWVKHRDVRMLFVNNAGGGIAEMDHLEEPWRFWLGASKMQKVMETWEERLDEASKELYHRTLNQKWPNTDHGS